MRERSCIIDRNKKTHIPAANRYMGADSLGRVRPEWRSGSPILSDPPPTGEGSVMSAGIAESFSVAVTANQELDPTEVRRQRGLAIAAVCKITSKNGYWLVPSQ